MIHFEELQPGGREMAGYIPEWLSEKDPRSAREQLNTAYAHGGGWKPRAGWTLNEKTLVIRYPGDPALKPVGMMVMRDDLIVVYPHAWIMVHYAPGKFEIARMD